MSKRRKSPASTTAGLAKRLMHSNPLLDLSYLTGIDLSEARQHAKQATATVNRSVSFENFATRRIASRPTFLKEILDNNGKHRLASDDAYQTLDLSAEYVLQLKGSSFPRKQLLDHVDRFRSYCEVALHEDMAQVSGSVLATSVIQPVLRWAQARDARKSDREALLSRLESAHECAAKFINNTRLNAAALEFLNALTFVYLVVAKSLECGISSRVTCDSLLIIRLANSSDWANIPERVRLQHAAISLHLMNCFYSFDEPIESKYGFSDKTLADFRAVMASAAQATPNAGILAHTWVYRWVRDKLDSETFDNRRFATGLFDLSEGEQQEVVELARRFGNYRYPVTVDHLARFLSQFGSTTRIRATLRLLKHTKFYPLWELAEAMERLLGSDSIRRNRMVIAPSGDRTGSTAIINYLASHSVYADRLVFAESVEEALQKTRGGEPIHFIDDCLLSGTQTLSVIGDLMGSRKLQPYHTRYCKPLSPGKRRALSRRHLKFLFCVATDAGLDRAKREVGQTGLAADRVTFLAATVETAMAKAFDPMGPVGWASRDEREDLKSFASQVGYRLLGPRAARKTWSDERRRESALGFSDFQRLLVFPYNVPKTTLTMLWEQGNDSFSWQPLFPGAD